MIAISPPASAVDSAGCDAVGSSSSEPQAPAARASAATSASKTSRNGLTGVCMRFSSSGGAWVCPPRSGRRGCLRWCAVRNLRRRGGCRTATLDALLALVEDHREHDHRALDDDLPEGRHATDHEAVGEEADDERADQRAAHGAPPAAE